MCEPAIHVLKSVFTRLFRQNAFASVATLRVVVFLRIHHRLEHTYATVLLAIGQLL